jgi:hypothetical protein
LFVETTNTDNDCAFDALADHDWNLEEALAWYYEEEEEGVFSLSIVVQGNAFPPSHHFLEPSYIVLSDQMHPASRWRWAALSMHKEVKKHALSMQKEMTKHITRNVGLGMTTMEPKIGMTMPVTRKT